MVISRSRLDAVCKWSTTESSMTAAVQKYRVAVLVGIRARFLELAATSASQTQANFADALNSPCWRFLPPSTVMFGKTGPESDAVQ